METEGSSARRARNACSSAGWWNIEVQGQPVGYASVGLNRVKALPQEGEIYELYLKPEFQGIGLGKRLFNEARQLLDSLGCQGVVVWCLEDNHSAVEFYRFQGGKDVAEGHETFDGKTLKKLAFVWS